MTTNKGTLPSNTILALVIFYLALLLIETFLQVIFPWDKLSWPETPFLTDMMKLNSHLPVFTPPSDCNSFVYSPGLEYWTFALLKPFGLNLDIRFCRVVNVLIGMLVALIGTLAIARVVKLKSPLAAGRTFYFISWGILWLLLSQSVTSDLPHPDNLHLLHAVIVLWLCFDAAEGKKYGQAIVTMIVAGVGIFAKQTDVCAWMGPAIVFVLLKPWDRAWIFLLALVGAAMAGLSLYLLWLPQYAKLFTFDLLSHQKVDPGKIIVLIKDPFSAGRAVLLALTVIACARLWSWHGAGRHYLICCGAIGFFTAAPNFFAYLKINGIANNLTVFEIWMALILLPVCAIWLEHWSKPREPAGSPMEESDSQKFARATYFLLIAWVAMLVPIKGIPTQQNYDYCRAIESAVREDVHHGRRILITNGAAFYTRAGVFAPPLDQGNSYLEIALGGREDLLHDTKARIDNHYYDRIYLTKDSFYTDEMLAEMNRQYRIESVIPAPPSTGKLWRIIGLRSWLMTDCKILVPR